jgi:hypothetical protein
MSRLFKSFCLKSFARFCLNLFGSPLYLLNRIAACYRLPCHNLMFLGRELHMFWLSVFLSKC